VVDDFSSKLDLPRSLETVESIDANHMEMANCSSRHDPRYRAIVGVLKQFVRAIELDGSSRPRGSPFPPLPPRQPRPQTEMTAAECDGTTNS